MLGILMQRLVKLLHQEILAYVVGDILDPWFEFESHGVS